MMMSGLTAKSQEKLGDSFSFGGFNGFSSSALGIYFSNDDDGSDAESYIEIQVQQQPKHRSSLHHDCDAEEDDVEEEDDHIELRISISSAVPLPQISPQCFNDAIKAIEARIGFSDEKPIEESSSSLILRKGAAKWRTIRFPAVKRVLGALFSNLRVTPEICHAPEKDVFDVLSKGNNKKLELPRHSNTTRAPRVAERGITKFLIKIRAMQIRPFLSSVLKNCQVAGSRPKLGNNNIKAKNRAIDDTVQCYRRVPSKVSRQSSLPKSLKDRDSGMKMNTVSCPSSISSSPINWTHGNVGGKGYAYAAEVSVQAAIAHCKSSFSHFPGFSFPPYV